MTSPDALRVWRPAEIERGEVPPEHRAGLRRVLDWSRDFLVNGHPSLGRSGPVCPYTQPSLRKDLFLFATPSGGSGEEQLADAVTALRECYRGLSAGLDGDDRELLTVLLLLPDLDPVDPAPLDALQYAAKDDFVAQGLMIGQFHPRCDEPGLWNRDFRPLRSPVPLLAVRRLLVFDLPFLAGTERHLDHYLQQFAPRIPARVRGQLVSRLGP